MFALVAVVLAMLTVWIQVANKPPDYLTKDQLERHNAVLYGRPIYTAWKYRLLSEMVVEAGIRAGAPLGIAYETVFIAVRILQNIAIFLLAAGWFRLLGSSIYVTVAGLMLIAWAMTQALFNSDLQFNTYADLIFYLIAAILIFSGKFIWVIPLMLLASLNRESSVLIPLLLLGSQLQLRPLRIERRVALIGLLSLAVWAAMQLALRQVYGWNPGNGVTFPGLALLLRNVTQAVTWRNLFLTLNIVPFLALYQLRRAPALLQRFFWTLVPLWFAIHFVAAAADETRLFLVPYIVVLVPIVLSGFNVPALATEMTDQDIPKSFRV